MGSSWRGRVRPTTRPRDLIRGGIATVYAAAMIYAGGMRFFLLSALIYAPGTILYFLARREQKVKVFTGVEWLVFGLAVAAALFGVYSLATGSITL